MVRCGLCCTARHVIKVCHDADPEQTNSFIDLLVSIQLRLSTQFKL